MKRWLTPWFLGAALAVVDLLGGLERASAHPPEQEPDWPASVIIAEWQQAGAIFGWITINRQGPTSTTAHFYEFSLEHNAAILRAGFPGDEADGAESSCGSAERFCFVPGGISISVVHG